MNFKVYFIVLINIFYACSSPYLNHLLTKRTRFCGSHLTNTLSMICQGRYPSYEKKSFGDGLGISEYEGDYDDASEAEIDFPFLSKALAKSFVPQKVRRQGVVSECCHKSCTLNELRYYYGETLAYNEVEDDYNDVSDGGFDFPFLSKEFAKSFVPQKPRREVADECCHKPCTIDEMRYYCGK
ncbi:bombyxin E-1-like [Anoplophora glabripennis]|uniref:bombyxin E-1-like n=1 Tax=Anoplophora glabripennis TaxID=217634 RepID=UPI000875A8A5|nr:bombyxin E-1-like [Anoplophora glabripennis]